MANIKVLAQYIKDLSFEVPLASKAFLATNGKPNIALSIDIDATKMDKNIYEITLKITANANADEQKIFICEVAYSGLFALENIEKDMIEQILLVYCPNLLFPYVRKIISGLTSDSNFAPLMIDPIDFADLYAKRKEKIDSATPINDNIN